MSSAGADFLHLNRDGVWPGFSWRALDAGPAGELALASLPALGAEHAGETLEHLGPGDGPEGLAVGPDGALFWTGPGAGGRTVFRRDPCDGRIAPLPLDPDAQLDDPRGLAIHAGRGALVIADRSRHRLLLVALDSYQLIDVWGAPGSAPGELDGPTGLAAGDGGALYVVDGGNARVQQLGDGGAPVATFDDAANPVAVAFDDSRLWILDAAQPAIYRYDPAGAGQAVVLGLEGPTAIAAAAGALYTGDGVARRLLRIDPDDGRPLGEARGFDGPVAALATEPAGADLWLHPGGGATPVRFDRLAATVRQGVLWGGPIALGGAPHAWRRLAAVGGIEAGRATLFVYADDAGSGPPEPDPDRLREADGGFGPAWRRIGNGDPDGLVRRTSKRLWVGVLVAGDGRAPGPRFGQLRVAFDQAGYERHLPVIYRVPEKVDLEAASPEPLERLLALFESFFADVEDSVAALRRLFDPAATPSDWIDWLAGWLAEPLDESWPDARKRRLIASAFERAAWRGTAIGLRRSLAERLELAASVEEPHAQTGWWQLAEAGAGGRGARLGLTTRLAASAPQGAVLDRTAVADGSQLIEDEDIGEPLFTRTAYRFSVVVPRAQASAPATLARLRQLIEADKPAHTAYCLRLVDPGVTVGYQALLGVDTLLGDGSTTASRLGERPEPLAIDGEPPIQIGAGQIGVSMRLAGGVEPTDIQTHREEKTWAS